ncbi:MAG: hypothetical protein KAH20_14655 [Methylococcales bacterium]|nr:hypothetical protein [Methylococcales bacterium]
MFIFILVNLLLGLLLKSDTSDIFLLLSNYFQYTGSVLLLITFIATGIKTKQISFTFRYDLFAVGSILIWFSYWPPFFREGSPMFYILPLYFAFLTAFFTLVGINSKNGAQQDEINQLYRLPNFVISSPLIIMTCVIISLTLPQHFMLFPIAITLLVARYSLACYLDNE